MPSSATVRGWRCQHPRAREELERPHATAPSQRAPRSACCRHQPPSAPPQGTHPSAHPPKEVDSPSAGAAASNVAAKQRLRRVSTPSSALPQRAADAPRSPACIISPLAASPPSRRPANPTRVCGLGLCRSSCASRRAASSCSAPCHSGRRAALSIHRRARTGRPRAAARERSCRTAPSDGGPEHSDDGDNRRVLPLDRELPCGEGGARRRATLVFLPARWLREAAAGALAASALWLSVRCAPSVSVSQYVVLAVWNPAPSFCMRLTETAGGGRGRCVRASSSQGLAVGTARTTLSPPARV